jgi:hypothetical protein
VGKPCWFSFNIFLKKIEIAHFEIYQNYTTTTVGYSVGPRR